MTSFKAGDIYAGYFPKYEQIPNTMDFNIDSRKEDAPPRPLVILEQIDQNRLIVAPLASDGAQNHLTFGSFVPLRHQDYPELMRKGKDGFVKTNQVQVFDASRLYPIGEPPRKLTELKPLDLDRVRIYTLYATQTERVYAKWIGEIVAKNVRLKAHDVEQRVLQDIALPRRPTTVPRLAYERGDVFICSYQQDLRQPPSYRLIGAHRSIVLTNARQAHIPPGQTIVVPLLPNVAAYSNYFGPHDVLFGQERACASLVQPMNRDWILDKVGKLSPAQMIEMDRGVISALGLRQLVVDQARKLIIQHRSRGRG